MLPTRSNFLRNFCTLHGTYIEKKLTLSRCFSILNITGDFSLICFTEFRIFTENQQLWFKSLRSWILFNKSLFIYLQAFHLGAAMICGQITTIPPSLQSSPQVLGGQAVLISSNGLFWLIPEESEGIILFVYYRVEILQERYNCSIQHTWALWNEGYSYDLINSTGPNF